MPMSAALMEKEEDIKKLQRKLSSEGKKIAKGVKLVQDTKTISLLK